MNILITGITGFSGSHIAEYLINGKDKIYGTVRGRCRQTDFIDHIKDNLTLLECDLTDYNAVQSTINDAEPDIIYHLAAQSFVPTSWRAPQETMNTNVIGTLNLLEAVRKSKYNPKMLIAGSSEEYGLVKEDEVPIKETNPLRPLSPYAVSKVAQDMMGYQYYKSYGLKIIRTRAFNLMGPRSGEKIVTAAFAKRIAEIEKEESRFKSKFGASDTTYKISVGNLDTIRDFNDIRDMVRAYVLAIEKCDIGKVYNISTGFGQSIRKIVEIYMEMTDAITITEEDEKLMRPSDVSLLIGDSTKFRKKTGWEPEIRFIDSLEDILNYWREK